MKIIDSVWKNYGKYTAAQLSELTHRENTPWSKTWSIMPFTIIPQDDIAEYYKDFLEK